MTTKEEMKDLCMEWYLKFGERRVEVDNLEDEDLETNLLTLDLAEVYWEDGDPINSPYTLLTPKALELIKS